MSANVRLLLISILTLFIELVLIRWVGTEVRIFAYLQNTVLVVCFFGLAVGCMTSDRPAVLKDHLKALGLLLLFMAIPQSREAFSRVSEMLGALNDFVIWTPFQAQSPLQLIQFTALGLGTTFLLMILIFETFVPLGRILGRLMDQHPQIITAYSINIVGSLLGIWLLVALSHFSIPPSIWILLSAILVLPFILQLHTNRNLNLVLLCAIIFLGFITGIDREAVKKVWSPYQKLVLKESKPTEGQYGSYHISVNNSDFQEIIDLSRSNTRANPDQFPADWEGLSQYELPLRLHPNARKVLIVGAGSGNDAAGALRQGAEEVTAVEIDPVIIEMGREYHPEKPYQSSKVQVVNTDARAFFATTKERFDVIIFGLLDSHTMTSMTNARLDHYVYTVESLRQVKELLKPGGILTLNFYVARPFIGDRIAGTLAEVFGKKPTILSLPVTAWGRGGVMFISGSQESINQTISSDPDLQRNIEAWQSLQLPYKTELATDDWPYLYLEGRSIPTLFFLLAGLLIALWGYARSRLKLQGMLGGWNRSSTHFFLLGAAFLLLEVQNISKASVVLGNTWEVNAVIISGILSMILLANLTAARFKNIPMLPVYAGLFAVCVSLYIVDLASFAFLPYLYKCLIVGVFTALPMYFSGLVFISSFAKTPQKDKALGANFVGALVGSIVQTVSLVSGMKFLLLIVTALYGGAYLTRSRQ